MNIKKRNIIIFFILLLIFLIFAYLQISIRQHIGIGIRGGADIPPQFKE